MDTLQAKIINNYKKISGFIFHYLIFLIAFIIAILIFQRILSQASSIRVFQSNNILSLQKTKLITEFSTFLKQYTQENDIQIAILQWDFQAWKKSITSVNNLITYKGFVVPRYFSMDTTMIIKPLSYFSWGTYDTAELEHFIHNFLFTKKAPVSQSLARAQLPISKSLVDDFNLSCLFEKKFSTSTCDYYLNAFLDSFFVYDISSDYSGLKNIFNALITSPTKKNAICDWLSKYSLYANNQNDTIKELLNMCGKTYWDIFTRTTFFIEIQKTLENQIFDKNTYKDPILNTYKLLSYQQQIYQDFLINKTDTYKISTYLDFVRELLKKQTIDPFYMDEIYRYNNNYLDITLEQLTYQSSNFSQNLWSSKFTPIIISIKTLNEWDAMLGFSWLTTLIKNTSLIVQKDTLTWTINDINQSEKIQKKLQSIYYLTIEKQSVLENTIDIIGYIKFFSKDKNETIKTHIIMEYKNDTLLVKNIELQNKPEMNDVIKNLLVIQDFPIGELYSYISKNLVFYEQTDIPTDLCPWLQSLRAITMISCTPTSAILEQKAIRYEFTLKNGGIESINISDKTLEGLIKSSYGTIVSNVFSLIDTIQTILNYELPTQVHEGTTNAIVVFEKIQQYMWIKTNDIADKSWKILVDISFGWINFIVNYVLETNTLGPRYFKDILSNNKPYLIQNFNLTLDDTNQNTINAFVMDPLAAIKNSDITAWQNYQAFTQQKKK